MKSKSKPAASIQKPSRPRSSRALRMPLAAIVALACFELVPQIRSSAALAGCFASASGVLLVWWAVIWARASARDLQVDIVLRPEHYRQAVTQLAIYVFWGYYWAPIRDAAALIAAQLVFAYAFDMLLTWSRRDAYRLGFGPWPIILSINLFIRFRDDWFALQFVIIAAGFLAKEFLRWNKEGRSAHIFNPSSFPLAIASVVLIATRTTHLTWGEDLAIQLIAPPQIYLFLLIVSLPGQFAFRVTTMTLPAVLTTYLFSEAYLRATGTYFFFDSHIPIAVFLGMHLLVTDPSTSPRTELGRILFGTFYGATVVGLYAFLAWIGAPTFYDKLLQVPLMNLMVRALDRGAQSPSLAWLSPERLGASLTPRMRSLAYVSLWVVIFSAMTAAGGLGDYHPGFSVKFWEQACRENRRDACTNLARLESDPCRRNSGWACNELGILVATGRVEAMPAAEFFKHACSVGFAAGCENAQAIAANARDFKHADPRVQDYSWILREGKASSPQTSPFDIYTRACNRGWMAACGSLAGIYFQGDGAPMDKPHGAKLLDQACSGGHAPSCSNLGLMYRRGDGVSQDGAKAIEYLKRACDLGLSSACRALGEGKSF